MESSIEIEEIPPTLYRENWDNDDANVRLGIQLERDL